MSLKVLYGPALSRRGRGFESRGPRHILKDLWPGAVFLVQLCDLGALYMLYSRNYKHLCSYLTHRRCYTRNMDLCKENERLKTGHRAAKYKFILTELDLALTFCDVALGADDDREKAQRNSVNAQRAYEAATHFMEKADFSDQMKATLQQKVDRLRTMLRRLKGRRKKTARQPALRPT